MEGYFETNLTKNEGVEDVTIPFLITHKVLCSVSEVLIIFNSLKS